MGGSENRQISRDSLFVMADVRIDGIEGDLRVRARNLSSGGMMAEGTGNGTGAPKIARGALLWVNIRNLGWIEGAVAWVQDNRFGIAFREEIDPRVALAPSATATSELPDYRVRRPLGVLSGHGAGGQLRKI